MNSEEKLPSKKEMVASIRRAIALSKQLKAYDRQIHDIIKDIQGRLWDLEFDSFESGDYSYRCTNGRWRFVRNRDQTPVLSLSRDDRCHFLGTLVIPNRLTAP